MLNRFPTEQGHRGACRRKWRLTDTDLCPFGETQTMSHIVEYCPLTKLNGGLSRLHSADEDAVCGWPVMVNVTHTRRRRRLRYSETNIGVTLESGLMKMAPIDRSYTIILVFRCKYSFTLYHFRVIWRTKYRDLEIYIKGYSRSLKIAPFDRSYTSSYSSSVVGLSMAASHIVFEIKWDIGEKWQFFILPPCI